MSIVSSLVHHGRYEIFSPILEGAPKQIKCMCSPRVDFIHKNLYLLSHKPKLIYS